MIVFALWSLRPFQKNFTDIGECKPGGVHIVCRLFFFADNSRCDSGLARTPKSHRRKELKAKVT